MARSLPVNARPSFEPSRRTASWLLALNASTANRVGDGAVTVDGIMGTVARPGNDGNLSEAPNSNIKSPMKLQSPNGWEIVRFKLMFGNSLEVGCWCLELSAILLLLIVLERI